MIIFMLYIGIKVSRADNKANIIIIGIEKVIILVLEILLVFEHIITNNNIEGLMNDDKTYIYFVQSSGTVTEVTKILTTK